MNPLAFIALGILGGVFVTAPVGPVNVMIMQRAFRYGFPIGLAAGVGASVADLIFATAAVFGVSTVSAFVEGHSRIIQLVGGILVVLFGARILWRQPGFGQPLPGDSKEKGPIGTAFTTFFLTLWNPATIFGFLAYFGALGEWGPQQGDILGTAQLLIGVAVGTIGWWCGLAAIVTRLRFHLNESTLAKVNVVAGALLVGFGALILGRLSVTYFNVI
ncbi:LysE family translocator [Acuticoccus yangtzensis]|uniref:LysE family translocator n=1 Tax=Acuticoccus yangtzensis TaxID=1443441 RepID=UPI0009494E1C|nr:LysE family transporter [Acuticoccus yangtzensis]ORE94659.1 translocator protein, LysE family [Stappia sp. 22II-S9-Z10]